MLNQFLVIVMGISSSLLTSCLWIRTPISLLRFLKMYRSSIDSSLEMVENNTPTIYDLIKTGYIDGIKIIHFKTIYFLEKRKNLTLNS